MKELKELSGRVFSIVLLCLTTQTATKCLFTFSYYIYSYSVFQDISRDHREFVGIIFLFCLLSQVSVLHGIIEIFVLFNYCMKKNATNYFKVGRLIKVIVLQCVPCHLQQEEYCERHLMKSEQTLKMALSVSWLEKIFKIA